MPKPVKKTRRFIDKKRDNVTTFKLVHRSQRDPLATDAEAPQRVLQPVQVSDKDKFRHEEQRKFGVYFDDNYDYMQHLRDKDKESTEWEQIEKVQNTKKDDSVQPQKSNLKLPSSVFASEYEEDIGILNRAAPRSGPLVGINSEILEVLETLDDAFEVEEVIKGEDLAKEFADDLDDDDDLEHEDEEVELDHLLNDMVQEPDEDDIEGSDELGSDFYDSEDEDRVPDLDGRFGFGNLETKSKFSEYSMSSSVTRRSEQLVNLDDRFEKFFDAYEEENTGGLVFDDIEGHRPETSDVMEHLIADFAKERAEERQRPEMDIKALVDLEEEDSNDEEKTDKIELLKLDEPKEKWDCESILSTYSNIYHHPKLITEQSKKKVDQIKISGKTGMPKDVLGKGLTVGALKQLDRENAVSSSQDYDTCTLASRVSELSIRNKHETLNEKRERKKAFKEFKKERRIEKKANKSAFNEEQQRQHKNLVNTMKNIQGQKLL